MVTMLNVPVYISAFYTPFTLISALKPNLQKLRNFKKLKASPHKQIIPSSIKLTAGRKYSQFCLSGASKHGRVAEVVRWCPNIN